MADKKHPTKKKVTKKVKKTPKVEQKLKDKLKGKGKEKVKKICPVAISQHSFYSQDTSSAQLRDPKSREPLRTRSIERQKYAIARQESGEQLVNEYSLDNVGRKKSSTHKQRIEYDLDDVGRKKSSTHKQREEYYLDDVGRKKSSTHKQREEYDIDEVGRKKSSTHKQRIEYDLEDVGRKKSSTHKQREEYYLDDVGRKKSSTHKQREEYDLDEVGRKKSSTHKQRIEYVLDDLGHKKSSQKRIFEEEEDSLEKFKKSLRNKRSSRLSLAGFYTTISREEAGAGSDSKESVRPDKFDYVAHADHARTNLKIALAVMEVFGVAFLTLLFAYGFSENAVATPFFADKGELNGKPVHIALGALWVFLTGNSMILFRLFNQSKVKSIKYFHSIFLCAGFLCVVVSLHAYHVYWKHKAISDNHFFTIHARLGVVTILIYIALFILSSIIYSLTMWRQRQRANFYHYHSFLGFVVFFMTITVACAGIVMEEKYKRLGISNNDYANTWLPKAGGIAGVLFGGGVLFIIIYPHFDFEKEVAEEI